ncbi:MAG: ATP-binding cassette domain-containing protein [Stygiobacter sp.]|nr:MAG: ATP-binding cassette domain-containing protein [Stygiobacter sp.]
MLKIERITKIFAKGTIREIKVLDGVSFTVEKGDFIILLGSNGSGKSTLLKIIAGFVSQDDGKVYLNEKDISKVPSYKRAKNITLVYQNRDENLVPNLTVNELFSLVKIQKKSLFSFLKINDYAKETELNLTGSSLLNRLKEQIRSLSGGEHQLLATVMASQLLAESPSEERILLLDEHIAHLDPSASKSVMELTEKLLHKYNLTILMVTHNINIAMKYGNRIIILKDKKIIFDKKYKDGEKRDYEFLLSQVNPQII